MQIPRGRQREFLSSTQTDIYCTNIGCDGFAIKFIYMCVCVCVCVCVVSGVSGVCVV